MKKLIYILLITLIMLPACSDPYADQTFRDREAFPAATFLADSENAEDYSLWVELLEYTELFNTFNLHATYTCFVPVNEAMEKLLQQKGITSVSQMNKEEAINLVKFHTIADRVYETSLFVDGMFPDSTASGDYLSIKFDEGGLANTYVNEEALIVEFNILVTNGVIHTLNNVLTPVTGTIMDKLDESYSIMRTLIEATGYDEFLGEIYTAGRRNRYTLFAVPDNVFEETGDGIRDVASLARYLGEEKNDYESKENKVNQFVAYHIINSINSYAQLVEGVEEGAHKNVSVMADRQLFSVFFDNVTQDFYINFDEQTGTGISMIEQNINCKNGVMHVIDQLMEVQLPPATTVQWDLCDYPEVAAICNPNNYQKPASSAYTKYFSELEDTLACYKSSRTVYYYYYYVTSNNLSERMKAKNGDFLVLRLGNYQWIEMQSPTVIAGKYNVVVEHLNIGHGGSGTKAGKLSLIIDNQRVGGQFTTIGENSADKFLRTTLGQVEFTETTPHTVRILAGDAGISYLDCITFEPVEEEPVTE